MDTKALASFQKDKVTRDAVGALFEEIANKIAIKDMEMERDVKYVPKNKEIWKALNKELDSLFGEKKQRDMSKARSE